MKKKRGARSLKTLKTVSKPAWKGCRWLILIDDAPIREAAFRAYRKLEDQLGRVRREMEAYESGDLPAYQRWEAVTLGPLLSELRALAQEIDQKRNLLDAVADEQGWSGCSRLAAYRRVMRDLEKPPEPAEPFEAFADEPEDDGEPGDFAGEGPKLFGDSDLPPGMNARVYDSLPAREKREFREFYEGLAELFEIMTGLAAPRLDDVLQASREGRGSGSKGAAPGARPHGSHEHPAAAKPPPDRATSRLKDLYRKLVRQLHPDLHGEQTAQEREFWHQAQAAYQAGDVERLEALAGRIDLGLTGAADHLPVQILLRMARELRESLQSLQRQLSQAKNHPAWNFRKKGAALVKFELKRRRELSRGLESMRAEVDFLRRDLENLAARAAKPKAMKKPRPRPAPRPPAGAFAPQQSNFPF